MGKGKLTIEDTPGAWWVVMQVNSDAGLEQCDLLWMYDPAPFRGKSWIRYRGPWEQRITVHYAKYYIGPFSQVEYGLALEFQADMLAIARGEPFVEPEPDRGDYRQLQLLPGSGAVASGSG